MDQLGERGTFFGRHILKETNISKGVHTDIYSTVTNNLVFCD